MSNKWSHFFSTRVFLFDRLKSNFSQHKGKLHLGWCSVFPPTNNGVAVLSYYFVKKLLTKENVDCYAIPVNGRIDKRLFPGLKFAKINENKLDIIIIFCLGLSCKEIAKDIRAKFIIWQTIHDPLIESSEKELFSIIRQISPDMTITMSKWAEQEYRKGGMANLEYVPAGVDTNIFRPNTFVNGEFNILFLGRAEYYKGIIPFLQSVPLVLQKYPYVKFFLHSPFQKNDYSSDICSLIKITKQIYPLNFTYTTEWDNDYSCLVEKYKNINLFVFPTNNEGFGIPLIEALSCGIPCIVLDKPPMNEIVIDSQTGLSIDLKGSVKQKYESLIASENYSYLDYQDWAFIEPESIAEKIIWFIEHPDSYKEMSEKARARAIEEYNLDKCVNKLLSIIENMHRPQKRCLN